MMHCDGRPIPFRPLIAALGSALLAVTALLIFIAPVRAWDEETGLYFYEPWSESDQEYSDTEVSSIHFDLVGALALAAGFSEEDAATIQLWSQLTDSELITGSRLYSETTGVTFPQAPPISQVITSTICPSPATTGPSVTMGSTDLLACGNPAGCFTSRWGPYGVFFHFPHDQADELGAIHNWAFGDAAALTAKVTFGYSSTAKFDWYGIANVYDTTPCFYQTTTTVDTGQVQPGSPEAFGIYLHSLGDSWSHRECIEAADGEGKPFAAHVLAGPRDPLAPCRWLSHEGEFGDATLHSDSVRTLDGVLAVYDAIVDYAQQSNRGLYTPITLNEQNNYLYDALYDFVHGADTNDPAYRREMAEDLRAWVAAQRVAPTSKALFLPNLSAP